MRKSTVNRAKKGAPRRWLEEHLNYDSDDCLKWPFSIGELFGISGATVSNIQLGNSWKSLL